MLGRMTTVCSVIVAVIAHTFVPRSNLVTSVALSARLGPMKPWERMRADARDIRRLAGEVDGTVTEVRSGYPQENVLVGPAGDDLYAMLRSRGTTVDNHADAMRGYATDLDTEADRLEREHDEGDG